MASRMNGYDAGRNSGRNRRSDSSALDAPAEQKLNGLQAGHLDRAR